MNTSAKIALAVLIAVVIVVVGVFSYFYFTTGTLKVELTDPPAGWGDASQIYLSYSSIEVHKANSDNESGWVTAANQGDINLTATINITKTLGETQLQPGTYNLIRFQINTATLTINGQNVTATVPSGKLQIAITQGGVDIKTGQTSMLLIELNIAIHENGQNFTIVPDIRATPA